jgi:hypothetical protein
MLTRKSFVALAVAGVLLTGCAGTTNTHSTQASTGTNVSQAASPTASETTKEKQYVVLSAHMFTRANDSGKQVTMIAYTLRGQDGSIYSHTIVREAVKVIAEDMDYAVAYATDSQLMLGEVTFVVPKDGIAPNIDFVNIAH